MSGWRDVQMHGLDSSVWVVGGQYGRTAAALVRISASPRISMPSGRRGFLIARGRRTLSLPVS